MGASEVWMSFTDEEKVILRRALKKKARDMVVEEFRLANRYWRLSKMRSKHKKEGQVDVRVNQAYREWLVANGLPTEPYDERAFKAWRRGVDRWTTK